MRSKGMMPVVITILLALAPTLSRAQETKPQPAPPVAGISAPDEQQQRIKDQRQPSMNETMAAMRKVCDWQLGVMKHTGPITTDWVRAAFCDGLMATYSATTDLEYLRAATQLGDENQWKPGTRRHADDHAITQMYAEIYMLEKDPRMIQAMRGTFDLIMADPKPGRVEWWWCDALFMAPPALARLSAATGDSKYLDYMNTMWWDATDFLYDPQEHLYYRDESFMPRPDGTQKLEKNGRKIFWSRGNGWVMGAICRVLDYMPQDYPSRQRYVKLYREMIDKLVSVQGEDGLWSASLLDPVAYPLGETSGSGFFCYGLTWGINNGYLDEARYRPVAEKAWRALNACVEPSGKLGYVQKPGGSPGASLRGSTQEYGCGAFLLAGNEMLKLMAGKVGKGLTVRVKNGLNLARPSETVELSWKSLESRLPGLLPSRVCLREKAGGQEVLTQIIYRNNIPETLLFQTDMKPREQKVFELALTMDRKPCRLSDSKMYGAFVPIRKDDFAWENDRIAYRMYGPALQQTGEISSGIDIWVKSVRYPIIDKWYKSGTDSYHTDHGEGLDYYKVGPSRGCGGIGVWDGAQLHASKNYTTWKILANGPIRTTFELSYDLWDAGGRQVSEIKRISLDAGSNVNRIESTLRSDKTDPLTVGIGIVERDQAGTVNKDRKGGVLSYWEPADPRNGSIGCGVIAGANQVMDMVHADGQNLLLVKAAMGKPLTYYAGAGWSKSGDFKDAAAWQSYVTDYATRLRSPLKVSLK